MAVALLFTGLLVVPVTGAAGAAQDDCKAPGSSAFGCVWTGPNYTGTISVFEGTDHGAPNRCLQGSPRSGVNDTPTNARGRYVFVFYHHTGCEKGGKAFGLLAPGQSDPDLPDVQSYAWTRSGG